MMQGFQDGARQTRGGIEYERRGGRWYPVGQQAQSGPSFTPVGPPDPTIAPRVQGQNIDNYGRVRQNERIGVPDTQERRPDGGVRGIPGAIVGDGRQRWNAAGTALEPNPGYVPPVAPTPAPPQSTPMSGQQQQDLRLQQAPIEAFTNQLLDVENRFRRDLEGGAWSIPGSIIGSITGNEAYSGYNEAGAQLSNDFNRNFRVPGQGDPARQQEERTARAGQPNSWESDAAQRSRFDAMWNRLNEQRRALGLPPVDREQSIAAGRIVPVGQQAPALPGTGGADQTTQQSIASGPGQRQGADEDAYRVETDTVRMGRAGHLARMIGRGARDQDIIAYARPMGLAGPELDTVLAQRRDPRSPVGVWMRANPGQPYPINRAQFPRYVPRSDWERTAGEFMGTPGGSAAINYLDAATAGTIAPIAGLTGANNEDTIRAGIQGTREENPMPSLVGSLAGTVTGYALGNRAVGGIPGVSRLPAAGRTAANDLAYGLTYGWSTNPDDRVGGALTMGALNTGVGAFARGAVTGTGLALRGVSAPAVQYLAERGVPMSVGQLVSQGGRIGQMINRAEQALASAPVVGSMIRAQRARGINEFNREAWDQGLAPINANVGGRTGPEAVAEGDRLIGDAYGRAFGGTSFAADSTFDSGLQAALAQGRNIPVLGPHFDNFINTHVVSRINPSRNIQGGDVQNAIRSLRAERSRLATQPGGNEYGAAMQNVENAIEDMVRRQNPGVWEQYQAANAAYRNFAVLRGASNRAANASDDFAPGTFTPADLTRESITRTRRYGGEQAASSPDRPFFNLTEAGQRVLPARLPNSGTADRMLLTGGLLGSAGVANQAGYDNTATGLLGAAALTGAASAPYTNLGQRIIQRAFVRPPGSAVARAGTYLQGRSLGGQPAASGVGPPRPHRITLSPGGFPMVDATVPQIGGIFGAGLADYLARPDY